ncbi:hypothetical protein PtrSN002B_003442 [Pyrenophora tritici-repentis]|uniref:Uncharacterized protein n=1 Tax=Pyrenophora tritici-repentis TaxID=45151 RepID=A0A2W1HS38_9PLEO|nr:hypothetical protein PtrV1_11492 [Pyrenophora tritici-repentis]KAF7444293.1 hypothetical protein A1F99_108460 [Pyrenophora tritici-repentis]KAF7565057.1 hypothetical protein PtrM4_044910 [Pyrenophora tritici-repentis]KAG9378545.1 hypothetical protein A1F94_010314 [Pyrenophora tritici-repentis]KAI0580878.1 hypothetical protein Alg215_04980 [Pyrenophora tritici-repentis]
MTSMNNRTTTSAAATSDATSSPPKRDLIKAKMAGIVGALQAIIESMGNGSDFSSKSELIENLSVCQDGCKDIRNNIKGETERAWNAYKAFKSEHADIRRDKAQDTLMSQAAAILHVVDEMMTVGQLRVMLLTSMNTFRPKKEDKPVTKVGSSTHINAKKEDKPVTKAGSSIPNNAQLAAKPYVDRGLKPAPSATKIKYKQVPVSTPAANTVPIVKPQEKANMVTSKTVGKNTTKQRVKFSDYIVQKASKKVPAVAPPPISRTKQQRTAMGDQVVPSTKTHVDNADQKMGGDEASEVSMSVSPETAPALIEKPKDDDMTEAVVATIDSTKVVESSSVGKTADSTATAVKDAKTAAAKLTSSNPSENDKVGISEEMTHGTVSALDDAKKLTPSVCLKPSQAGDAGTSKKQQKSKTPPAKPIRSGFRQPGQLGIARRVDRRTKKTPPQEEVESDHASESSDDEAWLGPAGFISAGRVPKPRVQKTKNDEKKSIRKNDEDETRESRKPVPKTSRKSVGCTKEGLKDAKMKTPASTVAPVSTITLPGTGTPAGPTAPVGTIVRAGTASKKIITPSFGAGPKPKIRYRTLPAPSNPPKRKRGGDDDEDEALPPAKVPRKNAAMRTRRA